MSYLCGKECYADGIILHVVVHTADVHTHLAVNDIYGGSASHCRIEIHHVGIETEV